MITLVYSKRLSVRMYLLLTQCRYFRSICNFLWVIQFFFRRKRQEFFNPRRWVNFQLKLRPDRTFGDSVDLFPLHFGSTLTLIPPKGTKLHQPHYPHLIWKYSGGLETSEQTSVFKNTYRASANFVTRQWKHAMKE